jgi:hypothetical protein
MHHEMSHFTAKWEGTLSREVLKAKESAKEDNICWTDFSQLFMLSHPYYEYVYLGVCKGEVELIAYNTPNEGDGENLDLCKVLIPVDAQNIKTNAVLQHVGTLLYGFYWGHRAGKVLGYNNHIEEVGEALRRLLRKDRV